MKKAPHYDSENRKLHMTTNGCSITISFNCQDPKTCIWHYVFAALAKPEPSSVQPANAILE